MILKRKGNNQVRLTFQQNNVFCWIGVLLTVLCLLGIQSGEVQAVAQDGHQYEEAWEGQWRGKIEVNRKAYLVIGIQMKQGKLTLDSPNQGLFDYPIEDYSFRQSDLRFRVPELGIDYQGTLHNKTIRGTFTQTNEYSLNLTQLGDKQERLQAFEGSYVGSLEYEPDQFMALRLHVAVDEKGYYATLDSPDQQAYGLPLDRIRIDEDRVEFRARALGIQYRGERIKGAEPDAYEGLFNQGKAFQVRFIRQDKNQLIQQSENQQIGFYGGALAIIEPDGVAVHYYGEHDAHTLYEIGSVTKTFVAYALAKAVHEQQVKLQDSVQSIWPAVPKSITWQELATHHSGLPRLPDNIFEGDTFDPQNPYAHYDFEALEASFKKLKLGKAEYGYSNYGFGLLGELLARVQQQSFAELMQTTIFKPWGMEQAYVALASEQNQREKSSLLATGYKVMGQNGKETPHWYFDALAGAGAIVASLDDMVQYVYRIMLLQQEQDPVSQLMLTAYGTGTGHYQQGLAWVLGQDKQGKAYAWHNGQTYGFSAFVGFYLDGSKGVVLLNNSDVDAANRGLTLLLQE